MDEVLDQINRGTNTPVSFPLCVNVTGGSGGNGTDSAATVSFLIIEGIMFGWNCAWNLQFLWYLLKDRGAWRISRPVERHMLFFQIFVFGLSVVNGLLFIEKFAKHFDVPGFDHSKDHVFCQIQAWSIHLMFMATISQGVACTVVMLCHIRYGDGNGLKTEYETLVEGFKFLGVVCKHLIGFVICHRVESLTFAQRLHGLISEFSLKSAGVMFFWDFMSHLTVACFCGIASFLPMILGLYGDTGLWCWIEVKSPLFIITYLFVCVVLIIVLILSVVAFCFGYPVVKDETTRWWQMANNDSLPGQSCETLQEKTKADDLESLRKISGFVFFPTLFAMTWIPVCTNRILNYFGIYVDVLTMVHVMCVEWHPTFNIVAYYFGEWLVRPGLYKCLQGERTRDGYTEIKESSTLVTIC